MMAGAITDQRRAALTLMQAQQRRAERDRRQLDHIHRETLRLVTALAHDLRHPVEAIRILAQPLTQEPEPVRGTAGLILEAVQTAATCSITCWRARGSTEKRHKGASARSRPPRC
ncbi:hypothetical protein VZ95_17995, partial [Elstera litoralis]